MTLGQLSDEDLQALYSQHAQNRAGTRLAPTADFSGLSDDGLAELYEAMKAQPTAEPAQPSQPPEYSPIEGMPPWERAAAGAGKAYMDTAHGAKQFVAEAVDLAANFSSPSSSPRDMKSRENVARLRAEADETKARDEALMSDRYGMGGNIVGNIALNTALPARKITTAIGSAAGYGASQPVGAEDSRGRNVAIGTLWGGAGAGAAGIVGRTLSPVRNSTAPGTQALIREAEQNGYKFSAGQATGNKHVQHVEGALEVLPMGGEKLRNMDDANQVLTNRTVAGEMGEGVDAITPEVIEVARGRIGAVMDNPSNGRPFDVDKPFFDDIYRIRAKYGTKLTQSSEITSMLDKLATGGKTRRPQISGSQYKETVSELRTEAEAGFRSGNNVSDAGVKREIAEALEGLAERNLTGDELEAFRRARRQYSATLIAEKSVRTDGSGNIRIETLDAATKKHRRVAHRQGTEDELVKLARIGQHLKKVKIPDSGTAPRSWWLKAAENPLTASLAAAPSYLAGKAMYSQAGQNWLRNGLPIPARGQVINALTRTMPGIFGGTVQSQR